MLELVWPFRNCNCRHDPRQVTTRGSGHAYLTWDEAQRITERIRYMLESSTLGHSIVPVYPNFDPNRPIARAQPGGEPNRGVDHRAAPRSETTCQGGRHRRARNDWTHSREIGKCGYPYDEPEILDCEACMNHLPRYREGHSFEPGQCRHAVQPGRRFAP